MRPTHHQPPDMKGKKTYAFRCGCCWARNCREQELKRIALREAEMEIEELLARGEPRPGQELAG